MSRRPPAARIVVDRVVVRGVPAAGLDAAAVSSAIHESVPALLADGLRGRWPAGRRHVDGRSVTWSPAGGSDALARAVADGVAHGVDGRHE
jgi:hypothetical protein